ncbi:MAG: hypothetical protein AAGI37_15455 [Planctomycetota bacterium]
MSLADDTNAPIQFKGKTYTALTIPDIATLIETLPAHVPRQLLPFVSMTEAMKYGRSPFGLPHLMRIVSDNSGHDQATKLSPSDQLTLAGKLTDRFYGYDPVAVEYEDDDGLETVEDKPSFTEAPASSPASPA